MTKDKDVVAELEKVENKDNPFTIKIWTEGNKDTYKVNEKAGFFFAADRDCYLYHDLTWAPAARRTFCSPTSGKKPTKPRRARYTSFRPKGVKSLSRSRVRQAPITPRS